MGKAKHIRRRDFLGYSAATAAVVAGASRATAQSAAGRPVSANSKIVVGMMGTGGRGTWLITEDLVKRPDAEIACVCDVDKSRLNNAANKVEAATGRKPKTFSDFREMLTDKDIDAIFNSTPDHWHALGTVLACQAGKHVYCEKPASHSMWEGRKMVEAARKYNRVVQLGTQTRSGPYTFEARKFITDGKLGDVHLVRVRNMKLVEPVPVREDGTPPPGVDYDAWVGPAPLRPFNAGRFHYNWHWVWDYSGGDIINDGIHQIDIARYLVGKDFPKTVYSSGGILAGKDAKQTPDTQLATWDFGDCLMHFELALWTPQMKKMDWMLRDTDEFPDWPFNATMVEIQGTKGMMYFERHGGGWQAWGVDNKLMGSGNGPHPHGPHIGNFLECVRTGGRPNADIEEGHRSTLLALMANISYRLGGRKLTFDHATETFVGDAEANTCCKRTYRDPWRVSETV
ncbi:MAG: Gfo/Idh/MocA family oxidoreductase [Planctomycetes bacterium]|nr:Gfo/Idh/MocA family oxidoreductase [Planctomycetota bacterium]